ncbi:hypothetical protein HPB50_018245 [Hyalomma asiaticum]|uniref:Uncharacterized protein n=1 Tax=Hyalomma asiaticum TaxID=266040 RepID=A0ACB7RIL7_HYAAI|nr:hypothetical protein HPB50_018245 [Hyalomma asiaticum]
MSATPHAHAIRLPFVQSLTLTCLLTSFHGPPCVADGDPMFVGHQPLHPSTAAVFVQPDPGSENERCDVLRKHTPTYVIAQLPRALSFCGCFTATSTTLTSEQHYIRPDKTSPASSGLGSMSATPHAHAIRLPFVQCYSSRGMELVRVTVVGWDEKPVFDSLVRPYGRILDYHTRFTGVVEEDMVGVETRLHDVQAALLEMFSADTILVGHSLDSDLRALRLIHGTVVDTTVVFPHHRGLPYKRALRNLAELYLHRSIQNNGDYQLL